MKPDKSHVWICETWKHGGKRSRIKVFSCQQDAEDDALSARHCGLEAVVWEM